MFIKEMSRKLNISVANNYCSIQYFDVGATFLIVLQNLNILCVHNLNRAVEQYNFR